MVLVLIQLQYLQLFINKIILYQFNFCNKTKKKYYIFNSFDFIDIHFDDEPIGWLSQIFEGDAI